MTNLEKLEIEFAEELNLIREHETGMNAHYYHSHELKNEFIAEKSALAEHRFEQAKADLLVNGTAYKPHPSYDYEAQDAAASDYFHKLHSGEDTE